MPYMSIVKINDRWHIPCNIKTECGLDKSLADRLEHIGGETATIPNPSLSELCPVCFNFMFKKGVTE